MRCNSCNFEIPAGSSFCPQCGKRMDDQGERAAEQTPPSQPIRVPGEAPAPAAGAAAEPGPAQVRWKGCYSPKAMAGWWLMEGVLVVAAIVVSILIPVPITWMIAAAVVVISALWVLAATMVKRMSLSYELSTEQLIHREGLLKRTTNRIETIDIDDVTYEQRLIERMLGIGSILIISSDQTHPRLMLRGIDEVQRVADLIDSTAREQRRKRSAYVEQI
jgi:membrane protein YdbS with pleckstrin-like domain